MASERISDMTIKELREMIDQEIELKLRDLLPTTRPTTTIREVLDTINRLRWSPPPGAKTNQDLLREDRDQ